MRDGGKHPFLCCYDYGMGGIWLYIHARKPEEITAKYSELKVVQDRPPWMTADDEPGASMTFDIDDEPTGWLRELDS